MNDEVDSTNSEHDPENGQQDPDPGWVRHAEQLILNQLAREFAGYRYFYQKTNGQRLTAEGRAIPASTRLLQAIVIPLHAELANLDPTCPEPVFLHGALMSPERRDRLLKRAMGNWRPPEPEEFFGDRDYAAPRPKPQPAPQRPGLPADGVWTEQQLYGGKE